MDERDGERDIDRQSDRQADTGRCRGRGNRREVGGKEKKIIMFPLHRLILLGD